MIQCATKHVLIFLFAALTLFASEKKPLDHNAYDQWKTIEETTITNNGQWLMFSLIPQEGDAELHIVDLETDYIQVIPRGIKGQFSQDSKYSIFHIQPLHAETRQAKIDKKKEDEMPKDSLGIIELTSGEIFKASRLKSFKLPEKGAGWLAYQLHDHPAKKDTMQNEAKKDYCDEENNQKDKKDEQGLDLILRNLLTGDEYKFAHVNEYIFSKNGSRLLFATIVTDSVDTSGVFLFNTKSATSRPIIKRQGKYKRIVWDEAGVQAAFVADLDTSKAKQRFYDLYYWIENDETARLIADTTCKGLQKDWMISEHGKVFFSKDDKKLFFGTAPIPPQEDTTIVEFEVAKVDVWNWKDPYLQPHQLKQLDEELKRSYQAVIVIKTKKFAQIANLDMPDVVLTDEGNATTALGLSHLPYRQLLSWEGTNFRDIFSVDLKTFQAEKIAQKIRGPVNISPKGRYIYWFDEENMNWYTHSIHAGQTINLTDHLDVRFYDEENDKPDFPQAYGALGWTADDKSVLLYDRYDIWQIDPLNKINCEIVTKGIGRQNKTRYRYVRLDPEEKYLDPEKKLLLKSFDDRNKSEGFHRLDLKGGQAPEELLHLDCSLSNPQKAKNEDVYFFTRGTFIEFPDLWVSDHEFKNLKKISDANPQQKDYFWGTVELVQWRSTDGKNLGGLLYKPENFDSTKKYPMIVYFYERLSDGLHIYLEPRPSPSTIRPSFYASRGYLVFMPDIVYEVGFPGKSALHCVVPGVLKLIQAGFVDPDNIGVQGQSWGGYQVCYLIANTNIFKASMGGAPVSNMTSAYGGIRWQSGLSRMFQYEHTQSRIGGTLWERPLHYLENSPLFRAPQVTTPLLMMHNDGDGAVPWYQGIEMFVALRRLGKPVWLLNYNAEEHNLKNRYNRKDLSVRMQQFFDHYLRGAPEPVWMKYGVPATMKGKTWGFKLVETEE